MTCDSYPKPQTLEPRYESRNYIVRVEGGAASGQAGLELMSVGGAGDVDEYVLSLNR